MCGRGWPVANPVVQVRTLCRLGDGVCIKALPAFTPGHSAPQSDKVDQSQTTHGAEGHSYALNTSWQVSSRNLKASLLVGENYSTSNTPQTNIFPRIRAWGHRLLAKSPTGACMYLHLKGCSKWPRFRKEYTPVVVAHTGRFAEGGRGRTRAFVRTDIV